MLQYFIHDCCLCAYLFAAVIMNRKDQLLALNLLIILIHPTHRDSLEVLLLFLAKVVDNEDQNKMTLNNVAMITAPNLFLPAKQPKVSNCKYFSLFYSAHCCFSSSIVGGVNLCCFAVYTFPGSSFSTKS